MNMQQAELESMDVVPRPAKTKGEATVANSENGTERSRAESSGGGSLMARHGSSASNYRDSGLYRCDSGVSFAGSAAGNRGSVCSNEAVSGISSEVLEEIPEADSVRRGVYGEFEGRSTAAIEEKGNPYFSKPVPHITLPPPIDNKTAFLLKATYCHCEEMTLNDVRIRMLLSATNPMPNCPPFVVGNCVKSHGYKMCLQVKIGKEDITIGSAIMKGSNDKQLSWPFNMIVVFRLINPSGGLDRVKMFRSDKNGHRLKECLSRPKHDKMNTAMGFPSFISRERLLPDGFVKDDRMMLECYLFPKDAKVSLPAELPSPI